MNGALFRKELRGVLPLALFWWVVWGTPVIEDGVAGAPDLVTFSDAFEAWGDPRITLLFGALMSLWISGVLIQSEHGDGTVEFLDSLPTTRTRVFLAKVATGMVVLWSGPILQVAVAFAFDAASRPSVAEPPPPGVVIPWIALACVELSVLFSVAVLLSFLRRFQWLAAGVLLTAYVSLDDVVPALRVLDVSALTDAAVDGGSLAVPWRLLAAQVPLAAACLAAAWLVDGGLGDRLLDFGGRLGDSAWGRVAIVVVTVLSVAVWIVVPAVLIAGRDDDAPGGDDGHTVRYASWGRSRATTARYVITYPTSLADVALDFASRADAVHDRVAAWFEADPIGRIDVDATGTGRAMYAGRAFHEAMQIDIAGAESLDEAIATLAHETAHLYIDELSNRQLHSEFRWCRAIHEGLANHIEHALFRPPGDLEGGRLSAALTHAWKPVEFADFLDFDALTSERDPYLVYTVGEMFMAALTDVHGDRAPVLVLRAYGRPDHPQNVHGIDRWRDAFQGAGFGMEGVVARFQRMLDDEVTRRADVIASVPRLRGRLTERTDEDGVERVGITPMPSRAVPDGWTVRVRFRRTESDDMDEFLPAVRNGDGCYEVARTAIPGRRASYQIGIGSRAAGAMVWEVWQTVTLGR